ncbi:MAG: histidine kinase [Polyangiaceae bacterium]|nr:histidine kinase [Polyangiaceae bacterium]
MSIERVIEPWQEGSVVRSTLRALLATRRLVPILVVSLPLIFLQWRLSRDRLAAPIGVLMCISFVLVAPVSFRVLFPDGLELSHGAIRLLLYCVIGLGVVLGVGGALPILLEMGPTLLTMRSSLLVCVTLFLVGGWGLGRDILFEQSLARERARAERLAAEAEHAQLLALRSHLDPHFLFNTLNAIAEWCREDGETAERSVLQLAGILRAILAGVRAATWPLEEELKLVKDLFALHALRDPNLFELQWNVASDTRRAAVPPMIVLPLAENAIKHGPAKGYRGVVSVEATRHGDTIEIAIESPGPYAGPREGSDGLPTVERRLRIAYGDLASFHIGPAGARTRVRLVLPIRSTGVEIAA